MREEKIFEKNKNFVTLFKKMVVGQTNVSFDTFVNEIKCNIRCVNCFRNNN